MFRISSILHWLPLAVVPTLIASAADQALELKTTGDAISAWVDGKDAHDLNSAYASGIVLGKGLSQSKPSYTFLIPPPTIVAGSVELQSFEILVRGTGDGADLYLGKHLLAKSFSLNQPYSVPLSAVRANVRQHENRFYVDVILDVTSALAKLDVASVAVRIRYPGPRHAIGNYLMCLSAATAIEEFRTRVAVPTLDQYKPPGKPVAQQALEAIRSTLLGAWTEVLPYSDLLVLWDLSEIKQQLGLIGDLAAEFWFNDAFNTLPKIGSRCPAATSNLNEVAAIWYNSLRRQSRPDATSYNALVDATDVTLNALQQALFQWGDKLTLYVYNHQHNPADQKIVNLAELARASMAHLLLVERVNGSTTFSSNSLLPALRANLAASKLTAPPAKLRVTISPSSAVNAGAQWRLENGDWNSSGSSISGLTPGNYRISFRSIDGWTAPSPQFVTITGTGRCRSREMTRVCSRELTHQPGREPRRLAALSLMPAGSPPGACDEAPFR